MARAAFRSRFMPFAERTNWRRVWSWWRPRAARRAAREWALDLVRSGGWVVLDTETTGLGRDGEVVQVAVVHPSGLALFDACVHPTGPVPAAAAAVHGLTDDLLELAAPYAAVHHALAALLTGRRVVCFNAAFDARLLEQTAARHGLPPIDAQWDCAMLAYASYRGEWSDERGDFRWPRLPGAAHGAVPDCRATLDLIRQMAVPTPWWRFW
ncbi:MAG TPA: 3'-5' exonuclease [Chloroflexota bacterium]|nr:3'-5' exonuclease [Chloroflexota bacterium]